MVTTSQTTTQSQFFFSAYAIENQIISEIEIVNTSFEEFGTQLLDEVRINKTKKRFTIQRNTTEIISLIIELCKSYITNNGNIEEKFVELSNNSAIRLNQAQIRRVESSPATRPSDGGLTIFFNPISANNIEILLAKLDIETYLERVKVQFEKGFPVANRTQKSCFINISITDSIVNSESISIEIDRENTKFLNFSDIFVADSNTTMAKFWHADFLELKEFRTDLANTDNAFKEIKLLLKRKLKDSPYDFNSLLNNCIGYFETNTDYKHGEMIQYVLNSYIPKDPETDLESLKKDLETLPEKKEFDTQFTMDKSKFPKATNRNIEINDNIYLTTKNHIENMESKIVAFIDPETDSKTLIIREISEQAYETFKQGNN